MLTQTSSVNQIRDKYLKLISNLQYAIPWHYGGFSKKVLSREHGEGSVQSMKSMLLYFISILHKIGMSLKLTKTICVTPTGVSS